MNTIRKQMLMVKVRPASDGLTYVIEVRTGFNWATYAAPSMSQDTLATEGRDPQVRTASMDNENNVLDVTLDGITIPLVPSNA